MRSDPLSRAAASFLADAEAFFRTRESAGERRVLPMIASSPLRDDLVKALRGAERAPENRRPLFLFEVPFTTARAFGEGLAASIVQDYEALRAGAAEEGVTLAPFLSPPEGSAGEAAGSAAPLARAAWAIERAASLLTPAPAHLEGIMVAIAPAEITEARVYREAIGALARARFSPRVRLAVHCPKGGPLEGLLGEEGARFEVDPDEVAEVMAQLGEGASSAGPTVAPPPMPSEEQRRAFEAETGRRLPSPEAARALRSALFEAGRATGRGDHEAAARCYESARWACVREGLALEEAMVLMALGGACLAAGKPTLATLAFARAAELARGVSAWPLACQAWLGVGGAHFTAERYEAAAIAYRVAAETALRGDLAILGVEAFRMAGESHRLRGAAEEARRVWQEAMDLGRTLDAKGRAASSLSQVKASLARPQGG